MSVTYFEMNHKSSMDRYIIKQCRVKCRIHVVGIWVFTIKFCQLCCIFEIFHNKMMGKHLQLVLSFYNISPAPNKLFFL